jgi:hypothetical protein
VNVITHMCAGIEVAPGSPLVSEASFAVGRCP